MERLPGQSSQCLWYDNPEDRNYATTSNVFPKTKEKRQNMLRSLARIMSELQGIQFDQIGMPDMFDGDKPQVTTSYKWKDPKKTNPIDLECDTQMVAREPYKSSKDYMTHKLDENWSLTADAEYEDEPEVQHLIWGVRKILDTIYAHPTIAVSKSNLTDADEPESFVLRHPDLDFQNILTDLEGNVTGIIDWEGCLTAPHCTGYASVPDFLRRDWNSDYEVAKMPHMDWQIHGYVQIYADAMRETGCTDATYTRKSAMYRAIVDAINDESCMGMIKKLFRCMPAFRTVEVQGFAKLIGKGCPPAEDLLKSGIGKLLEPDSFSL